MKAGAICYPSEGGRRGGRGCGALWTFQRSTIIIQLKGSGTAFLHTSPSGGGGEGAYKSGEQNAENGKTCTLAYSRGAHREARKAWEARKLQGVGVGVGHKYRVDQGTLYWRKKC